MISTFGTFLGNLWSLLLNWNNSNWGDIPVKVTLFSIDLALFVLYVFADHFHFKSLLDSLQYSIILLTVALFVINNTVRSNEIYEHVDSAVITVRFVSYPYSSNRNTPLVYYTRLHEYIQILVDPEGELKNTWQLSKTHIVRVAHIRFSTEKL